MALRVHDDDERRLATVTEAVAAAISAAAPTLDEQSQCAGEQQQAAGFGDACGCGRPGAPAGGDVAAVVEDFKALDAGVAASQPGDLKRERQLVRAGRGQCSAAEQAVRGECRVRWGDQAGPQGRVRSDGEIEIGMTVRGIQQIDGIAEVIR